MFQTVKNSALLRIYLVPLFTQLADGLNSTIVILYALQLNADILQVNLITTITAIPISDLIFGFLSDRLGRKPMLILVRLIITCVSLARFFATEPIHLIIIALFGGYVNVGDFYPLLLSMVGDVARPEDRQEGISTTFIFSSIGMLVSPTICTLLLLMPQMTLQSIYGIAFASQVIIVLYIIVFIRETKPKITDSEKRPSQRQHVKELLIKRDFQSVAISSFLYWFSRSTITTYLQLYAKKTLGFSDAQVASFRSFSNLAILIIRFLSATVLIKAKTIPTFIAFLSIGVVSCFSAPFAQEYIPILIIEFSSGISFGAIRILTSVLVVNYSNPENRGVANSILQAFESSGSLTRLITAPIAESYGFPPVFFLGGIMALSAVITQFLNIKSWKASTDSDKTS